MTEQRMTIEEMREKFNKPASPGICMDCGIEAKVQGKHKCVECALRKLPMDEQQAAAIVRTEAWRKLGSPKPPRGDLRTANRKFCNGCGALRLTDTATTKFDMLPDAARCRPCSGLKNRERVYGGTPEQHEALSALSAGSCMICGDKQRTRALGVDHDHDTNAVRGLLCNQGVGNCNEMIGLWHDSPRHFLSVAMYLLRPPAGQIFDPENYKTDRELATEILALFKEILSENK